MYRVSIAPRAKRELKQITKRYRIAIREIIDELQENPYAGKPLTRELTKKFSLRVGVFRIIYALNEEDEVISILTVGHRATVYQ